MAAVALLVSACASASPTPSAPSPSPFPNPTPSGSPVALDLEIVPAEDPVVVRTAIPGERVVFLVRVGGIAAGTGPVVVTAEVDGATVEVEPAALDADGIVEVTVTPDATSAERTLAVTFSATGPNASASAVRSLPVFPEVDGRAADAARIRDRFLAWLAAEHPELGLGPDTPFEGTIAGAQLLVVSHYLYYTDEWELGVQWHIMAPPDDWARMYLRRRFEELTPSFGAEIPSVLEGAAVREIEPPEAVFR